MQMRPLYSSHLLQNARLFSTVKTVDYGGIEPLLANFFPNIASTILFISTRTSSL